MAKTTSSFNHNDALKLYQRDKLIFRAMDDKIHNLANRRATNDIYWSVGTPIDDGIAVMLDFVLSETIR